MVISVKVVIVEGSEVIWLKKLLEGYELNICERCVGFFEDLGEFGRTGHWGKDFLIIGGFGGCSWYEKVVDGSGWSGIAGITHDIKWLLKREQLWLSIR